MQSRSQGEANLNQQLHSLHNGGEKEILNPAQIHQIQTVLRQAFDLGIPVYWVQVAADLGVANLDILKSQLPPEEFPPSTYLSSLSPEEAEDVLLMAKKYHLITTEETNKVYQKREELKKLGLNKNHCEILLSVAKIDGGTLTSVAEINDLLGRQTYGQSKQVESSEGMKMVDLQFASLTLANNIAQASQVFHGFSIQRTLNKMDMDQRLGEILYFEEILSKEQVAAILKAQVDNYNEKGFAISSLKRWDKSRDKELIKTLHHYGIISSVQFEEAMETHKKLELLGINRLPGEILLLKGEIKRGHVKKVFAGKAESLVKPLGQTVEKSSMTDGQKILISFVSAFLLIGLGFALERITRRDFTQGHSRIIVDDSDSLYSGSRGEKGNLFSAEEYYAHILEYKKKYPNQKEALRRKYEDFLRRYKKSRLTKKAKRELEEIKKQKPNPKAAREYEILRKEVERIIKLPPQRRRFQAPIIKENIEEYIRKYRGTKWEEKGKALRERLLNPPKRKKDDKEDSSEGKSKDEEEESLKDYLYTSSELAEKYKYREAIELIKKGQKLPLKLKKSKELLERALKDLKMEADFFKRIIKLLNEKKDRLDFYWNRARASVTKVDKKGLHLSSEEVIPWPEVPLLVLYKIPDLNNWKERDKDFYRLGMFLSTHNLPTLGYRYLNRYLRRDDSFQKRVEAFVSRREQRFISETGFKFYRDSWVRGLDYPYLKDDKIFYLESWHKKGLLVRKYGQRLTEKLKLDQKEEARKELIRWRKRLYKEKGVLAVDTMVDRGDPSKRIDVVIMCDGFTKDQLDKFHELSRKVIRQLQVMEPFRNYREYINVHRIDLFEKQAGITGSDPKSAHTWLGCHVTQLNQLKCDRKKVKNYSDLAPDADLVVVIANVKKVRSTGGGGVLTIDVDANFDKRVVMGMGFAFGDLTTEYIDPVMIPHAKPFEADKEYKFINATRENNPKLVKWHYWNYPPRRKPIVGCFEGAYYREKGYYRPTEECRMKDPRVEHYCVVCLEQLERSFYKYVSTIDDFGPILPEHQLFLDDHMVLKLKPLEIRNKGTVKGKFSDFWYLDSKPVDRKARKKFDRIEMSIYGKNLGPGHHTVAGILRYTNQRVRRGLGIMLDQRVWEIEVLPFKRPEIKGPKKKTGRAGKLLTFRLSALKPYKSKDFTWKVSNLPERAVFNPNQQLFEWCPGERQRGVYKVNFEIAFKKRPEIKVKHSVEIKIRARGRNRMPFFRYQKPLVVREGEPIKIDVQAFDVDGDHLLYSVSKGELPPGARLEANEGIIRWRPTFFQGGTYSLKIYVTDGYKGRSLPLIIKVENRKPKEKEKYVRDFGIFLGIRSPNPKVKVNAIEQINNFPPITQWILWTNLLRDFEPKVRQRAYAEVKMRLRGKWPTAKDEDGKKEEEKEKKDSSQRDEVADRLLFLKLIEPYVMELMDSPRTLRLIRASMRRLKMKVVPKPSYYKSIRKQLEAIDKYNEYRFSKDKGK